MNKIKVAVMNTSKEITEMLTEILNDADYATTAVFTYKFKNQEEEFDRYVKENNPDVILYDIAPPYRENYFLFKRLYKRITVSQIPFVLTTTNKEALESFVGPTNTFELIGKPYDLQEILDAVEKAFRNKKNLRDDFEEKSKRGTV